MPTGPETPPATIIVDARITKLDDTTARARCGQCGWFLTRVNAFGRGQAFISPKGFRYTFEDPDPLWVPTDYYLGQIAEAERRVGTGCATPADRALLRWGEGAGRLPAALRRSASRNGPHASPLFAQLVLARQLPTRMVCPGCKKRRVVNRLTEVRSSIASPWLDSQSHHGG